MGFRDKLKAKISSKKSPESSSGGSTPKSGSTAETHYTGRTDIEYYKADEIPKPKYKGKVDPAHIQMLHSYSFGDAFNTVKRKSSQALSGIMSPGGTKSQSRRASYVSRRSSLGPGTPAMEKRNPLSRTVSRTGPPMGLVREDSGESLTPKPTELSEQGVPTQLHQNGGVPQVRLERQATVEDSFSPQELEKALTQMQIQSPYSQTIAAH